MTMKRTYQMPSIIEHKDEIPNTIEGLEELKEKMQKFKDNYSAALTAVDFVIYNCDLRIHKLKKKELKS